MLEQKRGCGHRVLGGLYIVGSGLTVTCDRLPYNLELCPVCFSGLKFTRGVQMIDWNRYAGIHTEKCTCKQICPVCNPKEDTKYAIMWVGAKYYTPESFIAEARNQGVCKRIATVPRHIKIGETWILLAHKKAGFQMEQDEDSQQKLDGDVLMKPVPCPAVFYGFKPTRFEQMISKRQSRNKKFVEKLKKRGITPIVATKVNKEGEVMESEELKR